MTKPDDLREQINRCRRLARFTTDDQIRTELERMAEELEQQLRSLDKPRGRPPCCNGGGTPPVT